MGNGLYEETSHAFVLPSALRARIRNFDIAQVESELNSLQMSVSQLVFDLYGFHIPDRGKRIGV